MRRWVLVLLMAAMLCGCQMQKGDSVGRPVVEKIVVIGEQGTKIFTNEDKMQEILHKIRRLGQKFTPEVDPEGEPGTVVFLDLFRSDGTRERYTLKGDRFIQKGDQPWQQTESRPLLALMEKLDALVPDG